MPHVSAYLLQRYHARRKLAVQRMEREVEEKIAQLAMLEQENRQLKWQAHILENMLLDMDKQVRQQLWMCGHGRLWVGSILLVMTSRCTEGKTLRTPQSMLNAQCPMLNPSATTEAEWVTPGRLAAPEVLL